jgi:hypothetical protein
VAPSCNEFAAGLPGFCMGLLRRLRFSTADMELFFSGKCVCGAAGLFRHYVLGGYVVKFKSACWLWPLLGEHFSTLPVFTWISLHWDGNVGSRKT